jgi:hypothetical protein
MKARAWRYFKSEWNELSKLPKLSIVEFWWFIDLDCDVNFILDILFGF